MEKVKFMPELNEEPVEFFVVEQTTLAGVTYLLVTDKEEGDAQALILRDVTKENNEEKIYEVVDDQKELDAVSNVFENLLDDIVFEQE